VVKALCSSQSHGSGKGSIPFGFTVFCSAIDCACSRAPANVFELVVSNLRRGCFSRTAYLWFLGTVFARASMHNIIDMLEQHAALSHMNASTHDLLTPRYNVAAVALSPKAAVAHVIITGASAKHVSTLSSGAVAVHEARLPQR
jgi:uncharacterized protein (DUF1810 family)